MKRFFVVFSFLFLISFQVFSQESDFSQVPSSEYNSLSRNGASFCANVDFWWKNGWWCPGFSLSFSYDFLRYARLGVEFGVGYENSVDFLQDIIYVLTSKDDNTSRNYKHKGNMLFSFSGFAGVKIPIFSWLSVCALAQAGLVNNGAGAGGSGFLEIGRESFFVLGYSRLISGNREKIERWTVGCRIFFEKE